MSTKILSILSCSLKLFFQDILIPSSIVKYVTSRIFGSSTTVHLKPDKYPVKIRGATSDHDVFFDIFGLSSYLLPYSPDPRCIIDAGANVGYASIWYARRFPAAKIIAVEPDRQNLEQLIRNTKDLPNVTIVEGALWWETTSLKITNPDAAKHSLQVSESGEGDTVAAYTILDLMRIANSDKVDILKLDIEGAEEFLFRPGKSEWLEDVDSIVIEFHDRNDHHCAQALYTTIGSKPFLQQHKGENIFIKFI
jgi:FkbM family methyltransferase